MALILHECESAYGAPRAVSYPDFAAFVDTLKTPQVVIDKLNARTFMPVSLVASPKLNNNGVVEKTLQNVASVNALALDLDAVTEDQILAVLKDDLAGFRWAAHTTFSHPEEIRTSGKQRWRVWVELSEPVAAARWVAFREKLDAQLSVVVDRPGEQNTKNPNRLMFAPCVAPGEEGQFEVLDWRDFPQLESADPLDVRALDAMQAPSLSTAVTPDTTWTDPADEPIDRDDIRTLAVRYAKRNGEWDKKVSRWLKRILKGDAYVTEHSHEPTMDLARVLADELPHVRAEALAEMVAPSLAVMQALHGSDETVAGFTEKVKSWRKKRAADKTRMSTVAIPGLGSPTTASKQGESFASPFVVGAPGEEGSSPAPLKDITAPWIVQKDNSFFFRQPDGFYSPQYSAVEAETVVDDKLAGWSPVVTSDFTEKGDLRRVPFKVIARDAAIVASALVYKPGEHTYWDAETQTMVMSCCKLNPKLTATYNPAVEAWMRGIFGADAESALDWFAIYPQQKYTSRALLLVGAKGIGKTLIIKSLASVYGVATGLDIEHVQDWNQALLKCPLVQSDERTKVSMSDLRKLVGGVEPVIQQKFKDSIQAQIRPRVVLGSNDLEVFSSDKGLNADSLAATGERFLAIRLTACKELLPKEAADRESWWQKEIPEMVLWLAANRKVSFAEGERFAGQPGGFDVTVAVAVSSESSATLCAIAAQHLADRQKLAKFIPNDLSFVKEGVLHITYAFLRSKWEAYTGQPATHKELKSALHAVAKDNESVVRGRDSRKRFWRLDPAKLARFVADTGDYGEEDVQDWLAKDDEAKVIQLQGASK